LANLGENQRAIKYFKHALRIDENSVSANFGIGKTYFQFAGDDEKDKELALKHFQKVIQLNPRHYKAFT